MWVCLLLRHGGKFSVKFHFMKSQLYLTVDVELGNNHCLWEALWYTLMSPKSCIFLKMLLMVHGFDMNIRSARTQRMTKDLHFWGYLHQERPGTYPKKYILFYQKKKNLKVPKSITLRNFFRLRILSAIPYFGSLCACFISGWIKTRRQIGHNIINF